MSGVVVIGAMLMTIPDRRKTAFAVVLPALLLLALPTPFALLDVTKDASLWDPSLHWPRYAFYVLILPKVLPTMALFLFAVAELFRTQIRPSFSH